jgi:hypothetical protein
MRTLNIACEPYDVPSVIESLTTTVPSFAKESGRPSPFVNWMPPAV